jgi:hypothetical protein
MMMTIETDLQPQAQRHYQPARAPSGPSDSTTSAHSEYCQPLTTSPRHTTHTMTTSSHPQSTRQCRQDTTQPSHSHCPLDSSSQPNTNHCTTSSSNPNSSHNCQLDTTNNSHSHSLH